MFILQFEHNQGFKLCEEQTLFESVFVQTHSVSEPEKHMQV